ncbi:MULTISPECIES: DUF2442 domain-containing protein [unclassified Imperialibacter]|uniref:DUF2442 domain-containing protein n=1 Tax=unclassified Imperialibacter TaxID=2629706 RepID=UPI0012518532|nr:MULTISPECIES: DUF2442 domain-containing protein [unclassified Imperialibacter]CAD5266999.1 conserved hypothetical protein [Imperialibacter sp. 75]CAD5297029.1 conserved hypothetical protein [Imperialibacter sp. 89]VVT27299.1 conserved hypothetical protein [Imperialibacter sp. EC-SDR9]
MIITDDTKESSQAIVSVSMAEYVNDYTIRIHFSDRTTQVVDFKEFLTKSKHPAVKRYLNKDLFTKFEIVDGNLNWMDYDLIFPVWDLYTGKIS